MKYFWFTIPLFAGILYSCKADGVKKNESDQYDKRVIVDSLELDLPVLEKKTLDGGIEITWLEKSNNSNQKIQHGDVVLIDYKVRLKDSTIIDGNHLLNRKTIPFIVGFGFQPKGWDIAFSNLHVGDFVRIKLPSKYARGSHGVKNLIPDNADNFLTVRILGKKEPDRVIDGTKVWILEQSKKFKTRFNENNTIVFYTSISTPSNPFYYNSFAKNEPFELRLEDYGLVPGLKKALINAKKGDKMFVVVPSEEGYGSKGYLDLVKPNEDLFFNLIVADVKD